MIRLIRFPITISLLIGMLLYGFSSYLYINILEINHLRFVDYTLSFLTFHLISIPIAFVAEKYYLKSTDSSYFRNENLGLKLMCLFTFSIITFIAFPWTEDRTSAGASLSALWRLIWFLLMTFHLKGTRKDYKWLFLNIVLMIIDKSRTVFAATLLIHLLRRRNLSLIGIFSIIAATFGTAAFRSGFFNLTDFFESIFLYGYFGEGVNGALGSLQVLATKESSNIFITLTPFLQPFLLIFKPLELIGIDLDLSSFQSEIIDSELNEVYYPLAGYYLPSSFLGTSTVLSALIFNIYMIFNLYLIKILFKRFDNAFYMVITILLIKMSPYTFWNWILFLKLLLIIKNIRIKTPSKYLNYEKKLLA